MAEIFTRNAGKSGAKGADGRTTERIVKKWDEGG
jgi:hypothetical protein